MILDILFGFERLPKVLFLKVCTEILRHFLFTLLQTQILSDFVEGFRGSNTALSNSW